MARVGLRQNADFSEDTVAIAIDSYLTLATFPRSRLTIEPFTRQRERWLGADARIASKIEGFMPFYLQFKRPSLYPASSTSRVITDRQGMNPPLETNPAVLFFDLRRLGAGHRLLQHNVLYRLRRRIQRFANGEAVYVCPLFLGRDAYRSHLHMAGLHAFRRFWRRVPWNYREVRIRQLGAIPHFESVPALAEHISIPPHVEVATASHRYSFTDQARDVCFHSPEHVPEGPTTFGALMDTLASRALESSPPIQNESAADMLHEFLSGGRADYELPAPQETFNNKSGIAAWMEWGHYLKKTFDIEQFAFVWWRKD